MIRRRVEWRVSHAKCNTRYVCFISDTFWWRVEGAHPPFMALSVVNDAWIDTGDSAHYLWLHVVVVHRTAIIGYASGTSNPVTDELPGLLHNLLPRRSFFGLRRVMKPRNFVALSPSRQQVAGQTAMESIPLVFEPRSRFYTSPVVVLDFQVRV